MKRQPERTCIGCRGVFNKDAVVRVVAGPTGPVLDYREKMGGRAAYVCPTRECIGKALTRENLPRALHAKVKQPGADEFIALLLANISEKIKSLIAISAKAGKLAAGYSAVHDALSKGRVIMLLYASDISSGTKEKIIQQADASLRNATLFTRDELGGLLNKELVGAVAFLDEGLANTAWKEIERLKSLININE